jgi:aminopeptidase 2
MSTYIVAYANGHFDYLESSYTSPISGKTKPLRIYGNSIRLVTAIFSYDLFVLATPNFIHQAQFALDVKTQVLPLYEKVFDIEYPLPKLDTLVVSHI